MLGTRPCLLYTKFVISKKIYMYIFFKILLLVSFVLFPSKENHEHRESGGFLLYGNYPFCNKRILCYFILSFKPLRFWVSPFLLIACISSTNILLPGLFNSKSSKVETAKIIVLSGSLQEPHRNQFEAFFLPTVAAWENLEHDKTVKSTACFELRRSPLQVQWWERTVFRNKIFSPQ